MKESTALRIYNNPHKITITINKNDTGLFNIQISSIVDHMHIDNGGFHFMTKYFIPSFMEAINMIEKILKGIIEFVHKKSIFPNLLSHDSIFLDGLFGTLNEELISEIVSRLKSSPPPVVILNTKDIEPRKLSHST
jgi:hypothetical protein